jgi:hypothetical protein
MLQLLRSEEALLTAGGPELATIQLGVGCGKQIWLVVWNMNFMTFHILGIIIPIAN